MWRPWVTEPGLARTLGEREGERGLKLLVKAGASWFSRAFALADTRHVNCNPDGSGKMRGKGGGNGGGKSGGRGCVRGGGSATIAEVTADGSKMRGNGGGKGGGRGGGRGGGKGGTSLASRPVG